MTKDDGSLMGRETSAKPYPSGRSTDNTVRGALGQANIHTHTHIVTYNIAHQILYKQQHPPTPSHLALIRNRAGHDDDDDEDDSTPKNPSHTQSLQRYVMECVLYATFIDVVDNDHRIEIGESISIYTNTYHTYVYMYRIYITRGCTWGVNSVVTECVYIYIFGKLTSEHRRADAMRDRRR